MAENPHPEPALGRPPVLLSLAQFLKPYSGRIGIFLFALVFTAVVTLSIGQGLRLVIDQGFSEQSQQHLNSAILFILLASALMAVGTYIRFYLISWLGERVSADIRSAVFNHVVHLHPAFFETNRSGDIMSRLTSDTTLLQSIIGSSVSIALRSVISFTGALIMLLITNLKLSLIIMLAVPLVLMPILIFGRKVRNLSRESQDSIADVGSYAGEVIQHIKTVQSFTQETQEKNAFSREVERAFDVAKRRVSQRAILMAVVIMLVFSALSVMLWVGGSDVINGTMTGGELGAFIFYAILMATGVASLSEVYGELQRAAGATERLMELLHAENDILIAAKVAVEAKDLTPVLEFKNLRFCYPSRPQQPALDDFSLRIEEGKIVALVGPSGAGKSTLFDLIQRFYDPQKGGIFFGGRNIKDLYPTDLRQQIAVVQQQPTLFTGDVMYNIRYGKPEATDEQVMAAATAAHADEFIRHLPDGYQSDLGEQGVRLSGGQRQRIAIARALLKDPRVLLLDEATSALDAESEYMVQLALDKLMKGRTTVIIAHRLATILHADLIVVMDQGRAVATGSHNDLLSSCELYGRLAKLQFSTDKQ
ncbi:MAG: ABC transporter transmembrane domain-containing protein [Porticoccaceae bacterium]|nr:ATP-binding cassette domain-containing protein [Porticoccaceae bacterium]MBT6319316.1 ATP-binding cassette domain-containing protein [Porticoccaceae bacterium]MBT7258635.1 ATP-binding cassette domain-containing protein [Porticoccaceae bacterium]MBT7904076.1 ATP-binding cassette domain-containing protein [Porticoccaceae bacterium]MDB2480520.1 ABC transporter transmembrane domain-containing protein [Porticoccaceae bacterium]